MPVEVERITKPPKEIRKLIPKDYKHFEGYQIKIKWKHPRKIRGLKLKLHMKKDCGNQTPS